MKTINMKLKKMSRILGGAVLAAAIIASGVFGMSAKAEGTPREFPDLKATGSINVTMKTAEGQAVGGGTLEAYKIAEVYVDNGFKLRYIAPFDGLKNPIAADADLTSDLAKAAEGLITDNVKPVATQTVDANGKASFGGRDLGLYLVRQTAAAEGYEPVSSFLVTIPYYDEAVKTTDGSKVKAQYDVDASPKVDKVKKKAAGLCQADPPITKIVDVTSASGGEDFYFEFKAANKGEPMPKHDPAKHDLDGAQVSIDEAGGVQILKITTKKSGSGAKPTGTVEAGVIDFTEPGTYAYTVRELRTKAEVDAVSGKFYSRYIYDFNSYMITYTVNYHADGNLYVDTIEVDKLNGASESMKKQKITANRTGTVSGPDPIEILFSNYYGGGGRDREERTPRDPGDPGTPITPGEPDTGVLGAERDPGMPEQAVLGVDRLPQTGQLWWPVPILLIGGFALIGGGFVGRKRDD